MFFKSQSIVCLDRGFKLHGMHLASTHRLTRSSSAANDIGGALKLTPVAAAS
jgi:hypothetical protein